MAEPADEAVMNFESFFHELSLQPFNTIEKWEKQVEQLLCTFAAAGIRCGNKQKKIQFHDEAKNIFITKEYTLQAWMGKCRSTIQQQFITAFKPKRSDTSVPECTVRLGDTESACIGFSLAAHSTKCKCKTHSSTVGIVLGLSSTSNTPPMCCVQCEQAQIPEKQDIPYFVKPQDWQNVEIVEHFFLCGFSMEDFNRVFSKITFDSKTMNDLQEMQKGGSKTLRKKLIDILVKLEKGDRTAKKEKLKGHENRWACRLTQEHRIVFDIRPDKSIQVLSIKGHYDNT